MQTAYLLFDQTPEGDFPIGIYSTIELAQSARKSITSSRFADWTAIKEFTVDDPAVYNGRHIAEVAS